MEKYICIHGHFYQPPRENPWLEEVEFQDTAYPYHDWNERVTAESYAPNAAARILGPKNQILNITSNYHRMSFNFGPTLLSWLERHRPDVYQSILEADRTTRERFSGHGSAMAQAYNHLIMPLANRRDKETQIVWGIQDFFARFQRAPEGLWLPETAVDLESLDLMAENGIRFTILAAHQAHRVRPAGGRDWEDVSGGKIDIRMPYRCSLPSGRSIALFFYDGPIAQDVAFGSLLTNGEGFARRLLQAFGGDAKAKAQLVHVATDGETYGHHHRYGEMALAYCLHFIETNRLARITNYGEYLDKFPPEAEAEIYPNTSWSCFHGVARWREHCGCNSGQNPGSTQAWRKPLREAMDGLRAQLIPLYEKGASEFVPDPWALRNRYIHLILDRSRSSLEKFMQTEVGRPLADFEKSRLLKLLEMERHALLMFTSCGWFFDELSGIETTQVMQYAARAIQLADDVFGTSLEYAYVDILRQAPSNRPEFRDGEEIWEEYIKPSPLDLYKVGAHYTLCSLFDPQNSPAKIYCYTAEQDVYELESRGEEKLAFGKIRVRSEITGEEKNMAVAVVHLGGHNLFGGVRGSLSADAYEVMRLEIREAFLKDDVREVVRLMDSHFGTQNYSLKDLFRDEQRKILNRILDSALQEAELNFRYIYEHHYPIIQEMNKLKVPLPRILSTTVEFILVADLCKALQDDQADITRLKKLAAEMQKWSFKRDKTTLSFVASQAVTRLIAAFKNQPDDLRVLERLSETLKVVKSLQLDLDLWETQNLYYSLNKTRYGEQRRRAEKQDANAARWVSLFDKLGKEMYVDRPGSSGDSAG